MRRLQLRFFAFALATLASLSLCPQARSQGFNNRFDGGAANASAPASGPTFSNELATEPDATATTTGGEESPTTPTDKTTPEATLTEPSDKSGAASKGYIRSFTDVLFGAGLMGIPIACCSVMLVMFVFERAINLRRRRVIPKHFVKLFMSELEEGQLKPEEALEQCEENRSPISEVFAAAVKKWNRPAVEVEQGVLDAGERVANGLRRYLRLFNGIATVSPLLGLLGTVLGMIRAFNEIASSADAMGRPESLAAGISEALISTAGGLSVAIPAFIAYMYFSSRVDRLIIEIDGLGQQVVSAIASDAWKGGKAKSRKAA